MVTKFEQLSLMWIEEKRKEIKYSTYCAYLNIVKSKINPFFANQNVNQSTLEEYVLTVKESGLSQKSIKDVFTVLKMIIKYLIQEGLYESKLLCIDFSVKEEKTAVETISNSDFKKLYKHIQENFTFLNLGIFITMNTGLRIGEICALKWEDIDVENYEISINKTLQRVYNKNTRKTEIIIDKPKTFESNRKVPIPNQIMKLLKPLVRIVNKDYYVISNSVRPIEPRTYRTYFHKLFSQLGIKKTKFHCLRHTFATKCVDSNCDYKAISSILGHSNISTTMNLYVHPTSSQKKKCVEKMMRHI